MPQGIVTGNRNQPRGGKAFIWPSWVSGLMAGTAKCYWAAWFKAHYRYAKLPEKNAGFLATWKKTHDEMTQARANLMREDGWEVQVEGQNSFKIEGKTAVLAGKPDIVGLKAGEARIIDEKSGDPKDADGWQVRTYMWAVAKLSSFAQIAGEVQYRAHSQEIPPLTDVEIKTITDVLAVVGGEEEPARVPSEDECMFCNIADCPDRFKLPPAQQAQTLDF